MKHTRRKFIRNAATGLMVPTLMSCVVRGSATMPVGFWGPGLSTSWSRLVVSLGGPVPSQNSIRAVERMYNDLGTAGLLTKMLSVNAIVPDSLLAARVPFINAGGSQLWANTNFVAADLTVAGLIGNGTSKSLDTGFVPSNSVNSAEPNVDFGVTIISPDSSGSNTGVEFGSNKTLPSSDNNTLLALNSGGNTVVEACGFGGGFNISVTQAGNGYYSANRLTTTNLKLFFANQATSHAEIGSATTVTPGYLSCTQLAFATLDFTLGGSGVPANWTSKRLSFIAIHKGLTLAESATFYTLAAALRATLGGGNP